MGRRKITTTDLILAYRDLMLGEARIRLAAGFRPFIGMLRILADGAYLKQVEVDSGETAAQKDEFVEQVRWQARECGAIAVWFGCRGWFAPDCGTRPSRHPERKRQIMLFESSQIGDRLWAARIRAERPDGSFVACRWGDFCDPSKRDSDGRLGGRFVNLLGSGPRLVKKRP